jgi:hypothetical protein
MQSQTASPLVSFCSHSSPTSPAQLTLDDEGNGGSDMVQGVMIECAKLWRSSKELVHSYMIAMIVIHFIHKLILEVML